MLPLTEVDMIRNTVKISGLLTDMDIAIYRAGTYSDDDHAELQNLIDKMKNGLIEMQDCIRRTWKPARKECQQ